MLKADAFESTLRRTKLHIGQLLARRWLSALSVLSNASALSMVLPHPFCLVDNSTTFVECKRSLYWRFQSYRLGGRDAPVFSDEHVYVLDDFLICPGPLGLHDVCASGFGIDQFVLVLACAYHCSRP